jgi:cytosine/creatinine deaminase
MGEEEWLRARGVRVEVVQDEACIRMMNDFNAQQPELWNEDIGRIGGEGVLLEMKHEGQA